MAKTGYNARWSYHKLHSCYCIYIGLAYNYGKTSIPLNSIKDGFLIENPILNEIDSRLGIE